MKNNIKLSKYMFSLILLLFINIFLISNSYSFYDYTNTLTNNTLDELSSLNINSRNYVIYDRISNTVILGKDENEIVKMASTTKIMTAIVILENCDLTQIVEVSKKAAATGGSTINLKTGDEISIYDLLYGLLLSSGNDAAVALAETCAGSIENFCTMMNNKALELNLQNTNFESPHGLDSDNHYTTATELAILTNYALNNDTFRKIVDTKTHTIYINGYAKNLSNTNELLGYTNGVYGVKTGFTNGANRCLVTACTRDTMDLICVVLGADTKSDRGKDTVKLLDYVFQNYTYVNISEIFNSNLNIWHENNSSLIHIYKGINSDLDVKLDSLSYNLLPIKQDEITNLTTKINIDTNISAPIANDQILGSLDLYYLDSKIYSINILSDSYIEKKDSKFYFTDFFKNIDNYLNDFLI